MFPWTDGFRMRKRGFLSVLERFAWENATDNLVVVPIVGQVAANRWIVGASFAVWWKLSCLPEDLQRGGSWSEEQSCGELALSTIMTQGGFPATAQTSLADGSDEVLLVRPGLGHGPAPWRGPARASVAWTGSTSFAPHQTNTGVINGVAALPSWLLGARLSRSISILWPDDQFRKGPAARSTRY